MSYVTVENVEEGLHPSEVVVTLLTAEGSEEEVAVDRQLVDEKTLRVFPITTMQDRILVELPRETLRGAWRVWMPKASVTLIKDTAA